MVRLREKVALIPPTVSPIHWTMSATSDTTTQPRPYCGALQMMLACMAAKAGFGLDFITLGSPCSLCVISSEWAKSHLSAKISPHNTAPHVIIPNVQTDGSLHPWVPSVSPGGRPWPNLHLWQPGQTSRPLP